MRQLPSLGGKVSKPEASTLDSKQISHLPIHGQLSSPGSICDTRRAGLFSKVGLFLALAFARNLMTVMKT